MSAREKAVEAIQPMHISPGNPEEVNPWLSSRTIDGKVVVPVFLANRPSNTTDLNGLHQLAASDEAKHALVSAINQDSGLYSANEIVAAPSNSNNWLTPTPLPKGLPAVLPFNPDLLPAALRGWVMDISHRMQCPPDYAAVGAIVALSSLIGARAVVRPKARDNWQVVPNLWGLSIGRAGVKKSPALNEVLEPLRRLQDTEIRQWQASHDAWELDAKLAELQGADNERKAKKLASGDPVTARALLRPTDIPDEPTPRRFIVNDATVEKLGELLQENPKGILCYRDEIYGLLSGMDKQGQEGSRAFYLQGYDGNQDYTFDRIGRGTVHIPCVCLAMIGGIQPGRIQEYVRGAVSGGSADDGLLQRFGMTVWPDVSAIFIHVDQEPDTSAKKTAWTVFERFAALQPASDTEPQVWFFDAAAQALFVDWQIPFEQELRGGELHPALESHLAKYRKLIPALALLFALTDTPDSGGIISEPELIRALAWGKFLRTHANRLYSSAVMPETSGAISLLKKIKSGALGTEFTPRVAAQKCWSGLNTPEAVRKAADMLADYEWLRRDIQKTGGRPSERYLVNPAALAAVGAEQACLLSYKT